MPATSDFFTAETRNWRGRLAVSIEVMRELSRYTDPEAMYRVFSERMRQFYPTARQISLSRRGLDRPKFRVTRFNLWENPVNPHKEPHRLPSFDRGLLSELAHADEPRVVDHLAIDPNDPAIDFLDGQRSLLAIPVYENGTASTTLVLAREEPNAFPREQIPELVWMTNLFGRALQTLVLSEQLNEAYQNADYELRVIADLQQSLLPAELPRIPGLDVAAHYRTAHRAGGDLYDFFPLPDGRLGVLVADVSGHGSPAAVLMAITHSLAHSYPGDPASPGALLGHLNTHLTQRYVGATGNFVTAFYAVFDPIHQIMTYASAGHPAPRLRAAGATEWHPLMAGLSLPLGVSGGPGSYPEGVAPFRPGDRVALYTDGLTDATDRNGDPFGPNGVDGPAELAPSADAEIRRVLADLDRFTDGLPVADDRTLVVVSGVSPTTIPAAPTSLGVR